MMPLKPYIKKFFKHLTICFLTYILIHSQFTIYGAVTPYMFTEFILWYTSFLITLSILLPLYVGYFAFKTVNKLRKNQTIVFTLIFLTTITSYTYWSVTASDKQFFSIYLAYGIYYSLFFFIGAIIQYLIITKEKRNQLKDNEIARYKSEIGEFRKILSPHFFFNTLNTIDSFILSNDNDRASNILIKFSNIMQYLVFDTKTKYNSLDSEIKYLKNYAEIDRIRFSFSNEKALIFEVIGNTSNIFIAPRIFINFIENIFKHASDKQSDSALIIRFEIINKEIYFYTENKFNPKTNSDNYDDIKGIGLMNVKRRLENIYPFKHKLEISQDNYIYKVNLWINTNGN